jgi:hypothetical protein
METDFNVDVICNDTGEVLKEGQLLVGAHIYIAKRNGKIVRDEVEVIDLNAIDGGGQMEVRMLWVEIPEIQEDIRKYEADMKRAREFWDNWSAQRKNIIW